MSFAVDVNILLYASDARCAQHARARAFLEASAAGTELIYLAWPTVMSYLRMATHPKIFTEPLSPAEARRNIEALLSLPHCRVVGEADGFWNAWLEATQGLAVRGNLVPDAHLAALLRQHGISRLFTHDRDFRKFDFLEVVDPIEPKGPTRSAAR